MARHTLALLTDSIPVGATENCYRKGGGRGNYVQQIADQLGNIEGLGPLVCSGWIGVNAFSQSPATYEGSWTAISPGDADDKAPFGNGAGPTFFQKYGNGTDRKIHLPADRTLRYPVVATEVACVDRAGSGNPSWRPNDTGSWNAVAETWQQDNKIFTFLIVHDRDLDAALTLRCATAAGAGVNFEPISYRCWTQLPTAVTTGLIVDHVGVSGAMLHDCVAGLSTTTGLPTGNTDRLAWFDPNKCRLGAGCVDHTPTLGLVIATINDVPLQGTDTVYGTDLTTVFKRGGGAYPIVVINNYEVLGTGVYPYATQTAFRNIAKTAAAGWSTPGKVFDIRDRLAALGAPDYAATNALGIIADGLHLKQYGHDLIASEAQLAGFIRRELLAAFTGRTTYPINSKSAAVAYAGKRAAVAYAAGVPTSLR